MGEGELLSSKSFLYRVWSRVWNSGSLCILIAATIFSIANLQVKQISKKVPSMEIIFFRAVGSALLTFIYAYIHKVPHIFGDRQKILFLIFRGITGTTSMCTQYFAIQFLQLSEAVTIAFLNPLLIVPWAYFVFHDRVGWRSLVGMFMAIAGVVLIQRPPFIFGYDREDHDIYRTIGLLLAFNSAFFTSLSFIQIRIIGTSEDPIVLNLYYYIISIIVAIVSAWFQWPEAYVIPGPKSTVDLISISLLSFFAQVFTARGFQIGRSAIVASVNYLQVFYSMLADVFLFNAHVKAVGVLGSLCVFSGIILVNHEKESKKAQYESSVKGEILQQRSLSRQISNTRQDAESLDEVLIPDSDSPRDIEHAISLRVNENILHTPSEKYHAH